MANPVPARNLIAKALHANSPRKDKPFVPVNTGAVPSDLLESTLFGHEKGAFTSAMASKKGLFEVAHGGTLFLDEIGTMSMDMQAKIPPRPSRTAASCTSAAPPKSRSTSASSPPPTSISPSPSAKASSAKISSTASTSSSFQLPRLRNRREDIPLLAAHFLKIYADENNSGDRASPPTPSASSWTTSGLGNVRELETPWSAASVLSTSRLITPDLLPTQLTGSTYTADLLQHRPDASLFDLMEEIERRIIADRLERCHWNQTEAAEFFRIPLSTLNQKIKRLNVEVKKRGRD